MEIHSSEGNYLFARETLVQISYKFRKWERRSIAWVEIECNYAFSNSATSYWECIVFAQVKNQKEKGDYPGAKKYANIALSLTITNIVYVMGGIAVGVGMGGWTYNKGGCFRIGIRSSTGEYCKLL